MRLLSSYLLLFLLSLYAFQVHASGEALFTQCVACHGDAGQGNQQLKAPAIAGQTSWYLENQLNSFAKGYRGSAQGDAYGAGMAAISKSLNANNIKLLAEYIQALPKQVNNAGLGGDVQKGQQYYDTLCGSCHGPTGKGNEALKAPTLAGLNDWYLVEQINKFKQGQRGYHQEDRLGRQMKMMAGILPDEQALKDVAAYLSTQ